MTITGASARLDDSGYDPAAVLGAWTATKDEAGVVTVIATIVSQDTFRVTQRPLVFVAPHAAGVWRWAVVELQISGVALWARLGPREK
jgi:hypothetical protein